MFKKLVFTLISALFVFNANAGQMANVEYIHQLIKQEHNIDIKPDFPTPGGKYEIPVDGGRRRK